MGKGGETFLKKSFPSLPQTPSLPFQRLSCLSNPCPQHSLMHSSSTVYISKENELTGKRKKAARRLSLTGCLRLFLWTQAPLCTKLEDKLLSLFTAVLETDRRAASPPVESLWRGWGCGGRGTFLQKGSPSPTFSLTTNLTKRCALRCRRCTAAGPSFR